MKTLLYGGTFDPPHNGHMNNLRAALALVQPDRALVMPAGTPPHKHASATPAELRLQMCACFTALSPAVQVSDWEIRRGGRSYTVHTLEWLRGQDPDGALYLCVGSDMLLTFQEWYRWQDMLKMAALVVESRTGTDEAALHAAAAELKKAGGRVLFARAESYPCASSDIRSGKIPREQWPEVLPPEVLWRKKSPYPKTHNPSYLRAVSEMLQKVLDAPDAPVLQIVRREMLEQLLDSEESVQWYGQLMTRPQIMAYFVQMDYWMRKYQVKVVF